MQKTGKEIFLEYFIDEKHYPLSTDDEYFPSPEPDTEYPVTICGQTVTFCNASLVAAMFRLPEKKREMIYLYFLRSTHMKKSADITDDPEPQKATISGVPCGSYNGKWRELPMRNDGLLPYVYTSWVFGRVFSGRWR